MQAKPLQRTCLTLLLVASVAALLMALLSVDHARWLSTASILIGLAGIVQLEISGLFERWMDRYGDAEKYPYGPPSHITRQIIDNPDTPIRNALRQHAWFEKRTGFLLIVFGGLLQLAAIWL